MLTLENKNNKFITIGTYITVPENETHKVQLADTMMYPSNKIGKLNLEKTEDFLQKMKDNGYKLHHTAAHMLQYQSKKFNVALPYKGKFGHGWKVYSHCDYNRGSMYVTYFICD